MVKKALGIIPEHNANEIEAIKNGKLGQN